MENRKQDYLYAYHSDKGNRRPENQDAVYVKRKLFQKTPAVLAVICDGMGGLEHGEIASKSVTERMGNWFETELSALLEKNDLNCAILDSWDSLLARENQKLLQYGKTHGIRLGTTVTAMLFLKGMYYIAHVGDSRAYEISTDTLQLTKDQTFVAREVEKGTMTPEEAEHDKRKSMLLQCIGASEIVKPTYINGAVKEQAVYLLCSDGFRHKITGEEMQQAFFPENMQSSRSLLRQCRSLVRLNMERQEHDNISVIAVKVTEYKTGLSKLGFIKG